MPLNNETERFTACTYQFVTTASRTFGRSSLGSTRETEVMKPVAEQEKERGANKKECLHG